MRFLSNFGCKIIFMCSVNFWHQQDSNSLFKGSIGHVASQCKWPIAPIAGNHIELGNLSRHLNGQPVPSISSFNFENVAQKGRLLPKQFYQQWPYQQVVILCAQFVVEIQRHKSSDVKDVGLRWQQNFLNNYPWVPHGFTLISNYSYSVKSLASQFLRELKLPFLCIVIF